MRDKILIKNKAQQLINMTAGFCEQYLNEEYKQLCEKMIWRMSRKRNV